MKLKNNQIWICVQIKKDYKSGEFKMTHQATANMFSLFSRLSPVVSRILR